MLPSDIDANFVPTLWSVASSLNADPVDLASSLFVESQLEAHAHNSAGCLGINQMCPGNFAAFHIDPNTYTSLAPSEQLCHYVFPFWKALCTSHHVTSLTGRDVEWLNFLPATYVANAPDDHVICKASDSGILGAAYHGNKAFDHDSKGYITAGDIQAAINRACTGARWLAIHAAIEAGNPSGPLAGGIAGTVVAGIFFFIAYKLFRGGL